MADNNVLTDDIWADDKLGIKENVIGFANILKQEKFTVGGKSKVYSISAEFGIGKTFFCKKLAKVLEHDKVPVSVLNIWEMDFYENPLIPLLIKIKDVYVQYNKARTLTRKAATKTSKIAAKFAKIAVKYKYGINIDKFIKLYQSLKNTNNNLYDDYRAFEKELDELKDFLSSWAQRLNKPVVIIIDEIDRCRPDYAVKTLEILKHFFDIPGFVFVLSIDEEQLKSSVETLFGTKNFDGYKRKFINNSFVLPAPNKEIYTNILYEHSGLSDVIKQLEANEKDLIFKVRTPIYTDASYTKIKKYNQNKTSEQIIKHFFAAYSIWFNFSLRRMEQVFDRLVLFSKNILSNNELFSPDLAVFLVCLHEFDLKIYNQLRMSTSRIYGQHGGVLKHIYNSNKTDFSFARSIYTNKADTMFGDLNRNIIPKLPVIRGFSAIMGLGNTDTTIIHDDIDRFFVAEESQKHPLNWIVEIQNHETGEFSIIQNNGRITVIINSKRDSKWKELPTDVDTATSFDLEKFRKNYFDKMDFISNFK
ncbi:MAG: hypothetical protein IJL05_02175 [Alphaproteobacteria bacterium]|nr:hypothetical protein [Alphaproteobacteria bacterium]